MTCMCVPSDGDLPWSFQFGLDDDSEGGIAVNILPLVQPSRQLAAQHAKAQTTVNSQWAVAFASELVICEN